MNEQPVVTPMPVIACPHEPKLLIFNLPDAQLRFCLGCLLHITSAMLATATQAVVAQREPAAPQLLIPDPANPNLRWLSAHL